MGCSCVPKERDWSLADLYEDDDDVVDGGRGWRRASALSGVMTGDLGAKSSMLKIVTSRAEFDDDDLVGLPG